MSNKELSIQIMEIRSNNELNKEQIMKDKLEALENLRLELHKELQDLADSFDGDPDIKIVWDSDSEKFYATER